LAWRLNAHLNLEPFILWDDVLCIWSFLDAFGPGALVQSVFCEMIYCTLILI
jgi:hypothetical protein